MINTYQVIFIKEKKDTFWDLFEIIKSELLYLNPLYCKEYYEHFIHKAEGFGFSIEQKSFILTFEGKPFFVFLGSLFIKDEEKFLNCFEIPSLAIDSVDISLKKKKQICKYVNQLLSVDYKKFSIIGPKSNINIPIIGEVILNRKNTKLITKTSRLIDLSQDISSLKKSIRKRYHSHINWGLKEMQITLHDKSNIKWETILEFRKLHIKEAGRDTRCIETWEKQYEAILNNNAFCITSELENEFVSAAFFLCADRYCYYGSSVSRRDLFKFPISHALIWNAILHAKKIGALIFDLGETYLESFNLSNTEKEKNISYFKKGFGGKLSINYEIVSLKN